MAAVTYIAAVLLFNLTEAVTAIPCSDELTWKKSHAHQQLTFRSVRKCAAECAATPVCASLNFDMESKTCSLYSNGTVPADVVTHWTEVKSINSSAVHLWDTTCHVFTGHVVWYTGKPERIYTRVCGEPPDVFGSVKVSKHHPQGSVMTYTCMSDFTSCDKKTTKTSRCQTSGLWEKVSMRCARFRWNNHDTPQTSYYCPCGSSRRIHITISGTQTVPTGLLIDVESKRDILLHVYFGFQRPAKTARVSISTRIQRRWGVQSTMSSSWKLGQIAEVCITMNDGIYMVKLNGTTLHTRREPKKGIEAGKLFVSPSLKIRELKIWRLD